MAIGELHRRVGANLRRIRQERGLSQARFAEEALDGLHRVYYGHVERGDQNLSLSAIEDYASRLGIDPLELFRNSEDAEQAPPAAD
ncbi:helix-turn-helix transcriptional regulator [Nesterenkonia sp. MY13]|uniref:Helix-turn-helix transcriptional regulator n=2 Tax=Nesterenkonia TaxID=57494 RepID=A0A7X8TJB5_9MICC|nr:MULTISPECIES: helix-turn-helix transcriptional regulator [Nesterenkonia]NLS09798.1 helix-turn-helix transcriptional regulator [Nesterenkonia sedimenti]TLP74447.1 helix-turn-helix transcriptional regulator [Nesterenkonia sphaerica]